MTPMKTRLITFAGALFSALLYGHSGSADEVKLDAGRLSDRGVTQNLCLAPGGDELRLQRGVLYEDDGPAAGYSYLPNSEKIDEHVWIKKELVISAPRAEQATLLVGPGGDLSARINGTSVALNPLGKQGNYWQAYRFAPDVLRSGSNEFVLTGSGSVWIARDDEYAAGSLTRLRHPNRSAKSVDGGKTWRDSKLGRGDDVDGEYYVRVFLDQYQPRGVLKLATIDVGNLADKFIGRPIDRLGPIRIAAEASIPSSSAMSIRGRTSRRFAAADEQWSPWSEVDPDGGVIAEPAGRFLQLEIRLTTDDPLVSPALKSITIAAEPRGPADWTENVRVVEATNPRIMRSSIPFQYEPFDRQELARLRREHRLDDVVADADSEFELIQRLARWSATRWQRMHLKDSYPPYNALEILKRHDDGTPVGGFCQQYNIVFLQACESFGLVGRLISIGPGNLTQHTRGGHEAVEIWSNEFDKWIYVDGNTAWYAKDRETGVPLSLFELRRHQFAVAHDQPQPPIDVVVLTETKYKWPEFMHWARLAELRLIPRSNFLQQLAPLPLNQGMRGWFWTGHYVWTDQTTTTRLLYNHRVCNSNNWQWTLNQAQLVLEATERPGELRVHVDTETPGLSGIFAAFQEQSPAAVVTPFTWSLVRGENRLRAFTRNDGGRDGAVSSIVLRWPGE